MIETVGDGTMQATEWERKKWQVVWRKKLKYDLHVLSSIRVLKALNIQWRQCMLNALDQLFYKNAELIFFCNAN